MPAVPYYRVQISIETGSEVLGSTSARLKLTNLFSHQQVEVNVLVDTGATFMCDTEEIALQLGFNITEVSRQMVTLANGHQRKVPGIAPTVWLIQ